MKCKHVMLLASMGFAALLHGPSPALAQVSLGAAGSFGALGGSAVTCTDSVVAGDVGVDLGGAVTQTNCTVSGTVHMGDAVAQQAYDDFLAAYDAVADEDCDVNLTGQSLDGKTLTPGVYCFDTAVTETGGVLMLDGSSTDTWIFKIGTGDTGGALTATNFLVIMSGGEVCNNNVFWWTADAATLTDSTFLGTLLAGTSVTVTRESLDGRALAKDAVTLTGTSVCGGAPGGGAPLPVDHYKCYTAQQKSPKHQRATITLQDAFDGVPEQVVVGRLDGMCNPVSKNNEQIVQRAAHLKSYALRKHRHDGDGDDDDDDDDDDDNGDHKSRGHAKKHGDDDDNDDDNDDHKSRGHAKKHGDDDDDDDDDNDFEQRTVVVRNQFGKEKLRIGQREKLLVPSSKSLIPPALPGADPGAPPRFIDHYKCYRAEPKRHVIRKVTLEDQFRREQVFIDEAQLFCNPVRKDHAGVVTGILPRLPGTPDRLVCYELKPQRPTDKRVNMRDQFANAVLKVQRSESLCVPSTLLDVHPKPPSLRDVQPEP